MKRLDYNSFSLDFQFKMIFEKFEYCDGVRWGVKTREKNRLPRPSSLVNSPKQPGAPESTLSS